MRIIGIDPGYDRLGIAVIEKNAPGKSAIGKSSDTLLYSDCFKTSPKEPFYTRLAQVGTEVGRIIDEYKPSGMAIESLFITKNQKTAMHVAEARGVIAYEAARRGLPIFEYTPGQIKIAVTGHGTSDKEQVTKMIPLLIRMPVTTPARKILDDEYDAIAVALTCIACERNIK